MPTPKGYRLGPVVAQGKASAFGGPKDTGGTPDEGLFYYDSKDIFRQPLASLILAKQPPGTSGLFRRLANHAALYVAYRAPKTAACRAWIREHPFLLRSAKCPEGIAVWVADWGPAAWTKRGVDCSDAALAAVQVRTDQGDVELVMLIPDESVGAASAQDTRVPVPTAAAPPSIQPGSQDTGSLAPEVSIMPEEVKSYGQRAREAAIELLRKAAGVDWTHVLTVTTEVVHETEDVLRNGSGADKKAWALEKAHPAIDPILDKASRGNSVVKSIFWEAVGWVLDSYVGASNTHEVGVGQKEKGK